MRISNIVLLLCFLLFTSPLLWAGIIIQDPVEIPPIVVGSSLRVSVPVFIPVTRQQEVVVIGMVYTSKRELDSTFFVNEWPVKELHNDTTITLQVTFSPRSAESKADSLFFFLPLDTLIVPLSSSGLPLRVSLAELFLGPITEGQSTTGSFWVYNDGNSVLTVRQYQPRLPFYREGADTLIIPALDSQEVRIRFSPEDGQDVPRKPFFGEILEATIPSNGVYQNPVIPIFGISLASVIKADVNFETTVDRTSDTAVYVFYNRFRDMLQVEVSAITGDAGFEFLVNYKEPPEVKPGDSLRIPIRFTSRSDASQTASFRLLYEVETPLAEVRLQGMGMFLREINVVTDTLHASVGDTVGIPVRFVLTPEMKQVLLSNPTSTVDVVYSMTVNTSMAEAVSEQSIDSIVYDGNTMIFHIATRLALPLLGGSDTLNINTIPVRLLLGDVDRCSILIGDMIIWVDNAVVFKSDMVVNDDGMLIVDNIFTWPDGQKRLVNARKGSLEMEISPNPMQEQTQITVGGFSKGALVTIYTSLGTELFRRECEEPVSFTLPRRDLTDLAPGIYYCRLSFGRYSLVKLLRVE